MSNTTRRRAATFGAALVAVAVLFLFFGRADHSRDMPSTETAIARPIALADGRSVPGEMASVGTVAFDDGSSLELAPSSKVVARALAPTKVEFDLESGRTTFDVKPGGPRTWVVHAGDVSIIVLGTRFAVSRGREAVDVTVSRGKVRVESPSLAARILTAGESVSVPLRPPSVDTDSTSAGAPSVLEEQAAAGGETLTIEPPDAAVWNTPWMAPPSGPAPTVAESITRSRKAAPKEASSRVPEPDTDPMLSADIARREARPREAASILNAMVEAGDPRASLAAFTLGKIYAEDLGDHQTGAAWFERASALGLPSSLDEQAHARAVESYARAGSREDAARVAARYEQRYPESPHRASVRRWLRD